MLLKVVNLFLLTTLYFNIAKLTISAKNHLKINVAAFWLASFDLCKKIDSKAMLDILHKLRTLSPLAWSCLALVSVLLALDGLQVWKFA